MCFTDGNDVKRCAKCVEDYYMTGKGLCVSKCRDGLKVDEENYRCIEDSCVENDGEMCYKRIYSSWVLPVVVILNLMFIVSVGIELIAFGLTKVAQFKSSAMVHPDAETKESEVNLNNEFKEIEVKRTKGVSLIKDFFQCLL